MDKFIRWLRFRNISKHISENSIVCDIGCGKEAYLLKKVSKSIKYGIGFDEEIKNYEDSKFNFKSFRIEREVPLKEESCDIVILMAVLEHLNYPQSILNECFRILKEKGLLIFTTPSPRAKPFLEFLAFGLNVIDKKEIGDHKNYFSPNQIKKMLKNSGFEEKNIKISFFEFFLNTLVLAKK